MRLACLSTALLLFMATVATARSLGTAPRIDVNDTRGHMIDLSTYQRKTVLLYFWASWSEPGARHLRTFEQLHQRYQSRDLVVIGLNVDTDPVRMRDALHRHNVTFRNAHDFNRDVSGRYDPPTVPAIYLIQHGEIVREYDPFRNLERGTLRMELDIASHLP